MIKKSSKRRLLFLIPSLVGGGAERTLVNLLQKLDYDRYEVDLIVILREGVYMSEIPSEVKTIYLFSNKILIRVLGWLQKKVNFTLVLRKRTENRVKNNYDLGISFLDGNFTDLLFFIKSIHKRYTWVHSSYISNDNFAKFYKNKKYVEKLKKERYSQLDGIYFVSNDAKDEFVEVFGEYPKMEVLYNFIDTESVLKKSESESKRDNDLFQFIALGSLLPVKGFDRLIRATKIVKDRGFKFKVSILGSGPEKSNLESLVNKCNLNSTIDFRGFIDNPYPMLKTSDVFIMSSVSEALPTVLCEAMILGKATLVTNCSGCSEIVANGYYGLMSEQNDLSLAEQMVKYLLDRDLVRHYENQSIQRALLFDDRIVLKAYDDILSS